jgi:hypothetical protein
VQIQARKEAQQQRLDDEQDFFIMTTLVNKIKTAEAQGRCDYVALRQLVTYVILTDTASKPEFIKYLLCDGVNVFQAWPHARCSAFTHTCARTAMYPAYSLTRTRVYM